MKSLEQLRREAERLNITLIPMHVVFDGEERNEEIALPAVPRPGDRLSLPVPDGVYAYYQITSITWFHWLDLTNTRPRVELLVVKDP